MPRGARTKTVTKAVESSGAVAKFQESAAGQKLAKAAIRLTLTDFDRFKVAVAKKTVSFIINFF